MKRITLKDGEAITVGDVRFVLLRIEGNGAALVGVETPAKTPITFDRDRKPRRPLVKRPTPKTR